MVRVLRKYRKTVRRSPHGERGLKYQPRAHDLGWRGRSPHGERGLKCNMMNAVITAK